MHLKRTASALVAAVALLTLALGSVGAAQPIQFRDHFDIVNETATVCYPGSEDEFTVLVNASIDVHGIIFSEVPFNAQFHTRYVGTLTNSETGFTVGDDGHITDFVYDDGESFLVRQAGLIFQIVVPGQGSVAADVGLITFDFSGGGEPVVTIHGPHDVFEQGYDAAICPALAG